jgi:gamma-glutamylaminecyclotransferase
LDTFEVTYHKSTEHKLLLTERPYIAHFRYATIGAVNRDNTHPFVCGKNQNEWLMMNGTIKGMGNAKKSDSKVLAETLGTKPRHTWKKELEQYDCRFVTVNTRNRTYQVYNKHLWTQRDGIWFSKPNVLQDHLIAVYGTLKKGHGNYYSYLTSSKYVASGTTKDKYPLIIKGLPYMIEERGHGYNVEVDIFKVNDDTLANLDRLEGHPVWYRRKKIDIVTAKGKTLSCWLYFNLKQSSQGEVLHETYPLPTYRKETCPRYDLFDDEPEQDDSDFILENEGPICINCFHDLEHDGFSNYHCTGCDEWFKENEIMVFKSEL